MLMTTTFIIQTNSFPIILFFEKGVVLLEVPQEAYGCAIGRLVYG